MWVVSRLIANLLPGFALLGGACIALHLWARKGQDVGPAFLRLAWATPLVLVGGKALYLLERREALSASNVTDPGYSLYGSFFLVVLFWVLWALVRPFALLTFLDCVTPGAAFALVLGRINCFAGGCCGGAPCPWPWSVRFGAGTPVFKDQWEQGLIGSAAQFSLPVHPTQLYEAGFALGFGILLLRLARRNLAPGIVFFSGVLGYSLLRLVVEPLRVHPVGSLILGGWSLAQLLSFGSAVVALVFLSARRQAPHPGV